MAKQDSNSNAARVRDSSGSVALNLNPDPYRAWCWYDFLCPFSYVGQDRTAILMARGFEVLQLPFQAHTDIPAEGIRVGPRRGPMYDTVERECAEAALPLRWPSHVPDVKTALAAAEWVRRHQPEVFLQLHKSLFSAHFALGEDIGNLQVIEDYLSQSGVDVTAWRKDSKAGRAFEMLAECDAAGRKQGIRNTPTWVLRNQLWAGLKPRSEFQQLADEAV
jgi:predicted DsbA family dithiol-disulfide isomerase